LSVAREEQSVVRGGIVAGARLSAAVVVLIGLTRLVILVCTSYYVYR